MTDTKRTRMEDCGVKVQTSFEEYLSLSESDKLKLLKQSEKVIRETEQPKGIQP